MSAVKIGTSIPVIDLSDYLAGGDPGPAAEAVREACENVGFFQVTGHQVPAEQLQGVVASMEKLVALPEDVKVSLDSPTGHLFRGVRILRDDDDEVMVERLQVNRFDDEDAAAAAGVSPDKLDYFHPNVWPDQIADLKAEWTECFASTRELGHQIMRLFALALELPIAYFDDALELDVSTFSANLYPAQKNLSTPESPRVIFPEHTDSGMLTVLFQTGDYTGLQIRAKDGSWIDVPVVPGSFVINIGDLMAQWTNDRWMSTTHRVIASYDVGRSRVSIPTFYLPAVDTPISPLPTCVPADSAPNYPPTTPYEWEGVFIARAMQRNPGRV